MKLTSMPTPKGSSTLAWRIVVDTAKKPKSRHKQKMRRKQKHGLRKPQG